MKTFHIELPDLQIREALIDKINNLTKPKGSLGVLEELALQIGLIQQTLSPTLRHPHNILFAADHGIVEEGVSKSPKEITWQQLSNFLHGGAGVNFLCRQHGFKLVLVDAGVDYDLPYEKGIINCSVGRGTRSFLHAPAMSHEEMELCLERGAQMVDKAYADGCNVISFGEMGIGNTSPSSVWMHLFTGISLEQCVGAGSGLDSEGIRHKYNILKQARRRLGKRQDCLVWRLRNGNGYGRYVAGSRTEDADIGRWLYHDQLHPCRFPAPPGGIAIRHLRTSGRRGRTQTGT